MKLRVVVTRVRDAMRQFDQNAAIWQRVIYGIDTETTKAPEPEPEYLGTPGDVLKKRLEEING